MIMAVKKKFPYRAAFVACKGSCQKDKESKEDKCQYGCLGCGKCVLACKVGAVSVGASGIAEVDEETCIACGMCVKACPQEVIHLHECGSPIAVKCSNRQKGKDAMAVCPNSCIGCGICEKTCTAGAVKVIDNCAVIDERYCLSCGMCAVKCPRHAIIDTKGILA